MARINFNEFQQISSEQTTQNNDGVGFFSLKNDGDEAIVRIIHDSSEDFDIVATHPVKIGEFYRRVACLNSPGEPSGKCPMCSNGAKLQYRFFVHMIQYTKNEEGKIVARPVVWDRAAKNMSQKLVTMLNEYGPLSDCIFKVRRNGKAGDMETTYEILFANPAIYKPELYPKACAEVFTTFDSLGTKVMVKNAEEMTTFLQTGKFSANATTDNSAEATVPSSGTSSGTSYEVPQSRSVAPDRAPFDVSTPAGSATPVQTGRPNRYY